VRGSGTETSIQHVT